MRLTSWTVGVLFVASTANALSCFECDGNPTVCPKRVTTGWGASAEVAQCLVAIDSAGNIYKRRLVPNEDYCTPEAANDLRNPQDAGIALQIRCCDEPECNRSWSSAAHEGNAPIDEFVELIEGVAGNDNGNGANPAPGFQDAPKNSASVLLAENTIGFACVCILAAVSRKMAQ